MTRRELLAALGAAAFTPPARAASPFPVTFKSQPPYAPVMTLAAPGSDEFAGEKPAMELEAALRNALAGNAAPIAPDCAGVSPFPREYRKIAPGVETAVYGPPGNVAAGFRAWHASLGAIRDARFFALPGDIVRYHIRGAGNGRLEYRIGLWKVEWNGGSIHRLQPIEETITSAANPWFRDITSHSLGADRAFSEQLTRGIPYWRGRLDPASGIDLYGENGISAADIDGDGLDEIYVCQPGGLPNRLFKNDGAGRFRDIARDAGLDLLDDTAAALFADFRNLGRQDLILLRTNQAILFFNDGNGRFTRQPDSFRFATPPQGSFTSLAAADYDRDGKLDVYLCCYVYYQSEAQYRYPVPYHDAQNGPPNFLFRNRLTETGGFFEDVTAAAGLDHNNNRFSFAATWCDYNGDGWPDLFVTNDFGRKNLYRNTNGKFRDVAAEAGVEDYGPGMSAAWVDYDNDGRPDLLISNMWSACGQRVVNDPAFGPVKQNPALLPLYQHHVKGNSLYRNKGDGTFEYTGDREGIEICPWSWSCDAADFDNDGSAEMYIACGMVTNNGAQDLMSYFYRQVVSKSPPVFGPAPDYENGWNAINQLVRQEFSWAGPEPNVFFARRNGRYYDFSGVSGIDCADDSRAFAFADIDGDGRLDLIVKSRLGPQVRVYQNACAAGRASIGFLLHGVKSNRDAIGARIEVDGRAKWVTAGSAYLSQHSKRIYFGLGEAKSAAKVRITWPSGAEQAFTGLDSGALYEIAEGNNSPVRRPFRAPAELPAGAPAADNRARLHDTWMWEPVPLPEKRTGPTLLFIHAGEPQPPLGLPLQTLDLRSAPTDLAAAYAIFRRYLFDYRVDLETPLILLIDSASRMRKIYASTPDRSTVLADLRTADAPVPDPRGLPFEGAFTGQPRRDYYKFGGALLQAGYPEQALPYLEEMLRRTPDNPKALFAVGRIHLLAKRLPQARAALQRALAVNPDLAEGWNELGGVESEAGNQEQALAHYGKSLALRPDSPFTLMNAAQVHEKLDHPAEAERLYRRALEVAPANGDAANSLGLLLAKQGRAAEARKLFEQAIAARRDDASAINNLGVLYVNIGQFNDAIAAFQYGISVAPDDETLYMNLARVWLRSGSREKAGEVMRQLLARKPGNAIATRALRELESQ